MDQLKNKYLTIDEVCSLLSISKTSLWRIRSRRHIKSFKYGAKILFRISDIEQFIEKYTL